MKKLLIALTVIISKIEIGFSATGERKDDYLVLVVPMVFLTLLWLSYELRARIKARKRLLQEELHPDQDAASPDMNHEELRNDML